MSVWWPQVAERLEVIFTPHAEKVWAYKREREAPEYVVVGWDEEGDSGSFSVERSSLGNTLLTETGQIRCIVMCNAARTVPTSRLFDIAGALSAAIAQDQTLGILPAGSTVTSQADVTTPVGAQGVAQRLDLIVTYTAPY